MRYATIALASIFTLALIMPAYAEDYDISINVNSNTNDCVPDCLSPQVVVMNIGDKVIWTNAEYCDEADETTWEACSRNYAFVSGNPVDGMDGQWDTGTIKPGETRSITFNTEGQFDYYDPGHTWMQGSIIVGTVTKEVEIITENGTGVIETEIQVVEIEEPTFVQRPDRPVINDELLESLYPDRIEDIRQMINIGLNVDADNVHVMDYIFYESIGNNQITIGNNEDGSDNTLEFSFREPVSGTIVLKMSNDLIGETLAVIDQNTQVLDFRYASHGDFSIVEVDLNDTRKITLVATYVVPEYLGGALVMLIIASVVIGTMVFIAKRKPTLVLDQ